MKFNVLLLLLTILTFGDTPIAADAVDTVHTTHSDSPFYFLPIKGLVTR